MVSNSVSQDMIPEMIEQILGLWQTELDRLSAKKNPDKDDIALTMKLSAQLVQLFTVFQAFKREIAKETRGKLADTLVGMTRNWNTIPLNKS